MDETLNPNTGSPYCAKHIRYTRWTKGNDGCCTKQSGAKRAGTLHEKKKTRVYQYSLHIQKKMAWAARLPLTLAVNGTVNGTNDELNRWSEIMDAGAV